MNFNVYLNKEVGKKITKMAKSLHRSRNSIVNEALEESRKSFEEFKANLEKEVLETKTSLLSEVNNIAEQIANKAIKSDVNEKISA